MHVPRHAFLFLLALFLVQVLGQGYYLGELSQAATSVTTTIGQAGGGWCLGIPWNTGLQFPPDITQDIYLVGYVVEPYVPSGSVAVSNWTFQAYTDNAGQVGTFIAGTRLEVTGATWSKTSPANDCDYLRPQNTTITDPPFIRQNLPLPAPVKLPRNISAGSVIRYWTCVWSNPEIPLLQVGASSFMFQENGTGWSLIVPPPPQPLDNNPYPAVSWLANLQPKISPPSGTLSAVKVTYGNTGATNDNTFNNTGVSLAVGLAIKPITDAKLYAISGVGIYLNAAATGNFLFAVYGPMSDNLYFQPGSFALANVTVTSLAAGPNYIPLPTPLFVSINITTPTQYFIYFASSVDVQIRLSTDPSAPQADSVLIGHSRKDKCIPNFVLENLFMETDANGVATGIAMWFNVTTDATIDPALTTTAAATTPPLVVTTAPPTTNVNSTLPPTSYQPSNITADPNATLNTPPISDGNMGGGVEIRTNPPPPPPPTTALRRPKYKMLWKLVARIMDSCYPNIGNVIVGYDENLYTISYDGTGCQKRQQQKRYYQSTLQVAYDAPTAAEQYAALNKTGITLVAAQIADTYVLAQVKSKPPMVIIWVLLGVLGAIALVIVISVCGYYCCRSWVYEMLGKEEEDYGVDL